MSDFSAALAFVHDALRDLHGRGVPLRASLESLEALADAGTPSVVIARAKPAEAEERVPPAGPRLATAAPAAELAKRFIPPPAVLPPLPPLPPLEPITTPEGETKVAQLAALRGPALVCTRCPHLVKSRTQVVFGVGNPEAELMFVGEAPGEDEDQQGEPFVGKAGQLLTKIIETMGFTRGDIYIANVLKCRPDMASGMPGNRKPTPAEMATCRPWLEQQIEIIRPRLLVALGATAMEGLLGETSPMNKLRGRWHDFRGTPLMATYHPAYLLRNQSLGEKRKVWEDMLLVLERMGRPISEKQRGFFLPKSGGATL